MTIDFDKVKVGDHVTARLRVINKARDTSNEIQCLCLQAEEQNFSPLWFYNKDIVTHEPRALAVGDIVRFPRETRKFKIVCVDDEVVWLKHIETGSHATTMLHYIERAE